MSAHDIGAWCRRPRFADIEFAASIGLNRLDVMVNEMAKDRAPRKFDLDWDVNSYRNVVGKAQQEGIQVHFTSWLMPHAEFCKQAVDQLRGLLSETGAAGVMFDVEEPWTQAIRPHYGDAVSIMTEGMKGIWWGVTGIGWASKWVQNIAAAATYVVPQLYATSTSKLDPNEFGGPMQHWAKWNHNVVPALAAYRTTAAKIRESWAEVTPADTVLFWALRHIKSNATYAKTIAALAKQGKQAA